MKVTIDVELGNEAMQSRRDVREAIDHSFTRKGDYATMTAPLKPGDADVIHDGNGNVVGTWAVKP